MKKEIILIISVVAILSIIYILFYSKNFLTPKIIEVSKSDSSDNRPNYCKLIDNENKCIKSEIFKYLPPYPADFEQMYELIFYGKINDLSRVDKKYWEQPEILPTWKTSGIDIYLNPEKGRFGAFGFGCYPSEATTTLKPGQAVKLTTWLHTTWGIQNLQGMSLKAIYPSHAESEQGISVSQESSVSNYFDSSVVPNVVLLGPTWPYFESGTSFDHNGWIVPVTVEIKVHPETPAGSYAVGLMPYEPPQKMNDDWILKYKLRYTPIQYYNIGKPYFTVFLNVE